MVFLSGLHDISCPSLNSSASKSSEEESSAVLDSNIPSSESMASSGSGFGKAGGTGSLWKFAAWLSSPPAGSEWGCRLQLVEGVDRVEWRSRGLDMGVVRLEAGGSEGTEWSAGRWKDSEGVDQVERWCRGLVMGAVRLEAGGSMGSGWSAGKWNSGADELHLLAVDESVGWCELQWMGSDGASGGSGREDL